MNNICITGRIGRDPELKTTAKGVAVCSTVVAVDRPGVKGETDWFDITAWRKSAEFLSAYFKKGDMIGICGSMVSRKYEDKNGNKRIQWELMVDNISFCGGKAEKNAAFEPIAITPADEADLPF